MNLLAIINEPEESKGFLKYVLNMAKDFEAKTHVLYIKPSIEYTLASTGTTGLAAAQVHNDLDTQIRIANETIEKTIDKVKALLSYHPEVKFNSTTYAAPEAVKAYLKDEEIDMVLLKGKQKESFWSQTTANMDIIETVDCPVWIIPNNSVYQAFKEVLYATDYKEEDFITLNRLSALIRRFSPNITALHITDNIDFEERVKRSGYLEMLKKETYYDRLSLKVISEGDIEDLTFALNEFAASRNADLIVILKENYSFFERIFKRDPAKKIVRKAMLPVLIFHEMSDE